MKHPHKDLIKLLVDRVELGPHLLGRIKRESERIIKPWSIVEEMDRGKTALELLTIPNLFDEDWEFQFDTPKDVFGEPIQEGGQYEVRSVVALPDNDGLPEGARIQIQEIHDDIAQFRVRRVDGIEKGVLVPFEVKVILHPHTPSKNTTSSDTQETKSTNPRDIQPYYNGPGSQKFWSRLSTLSNDYKEEMWQMARLMKSLEMSIILGMAHDDHCKGRTNETSA